MRNSGHADAMDTRIPWTTYVVAAGRSGERLAVGAVMDPSDARGPLDIRSDSGSRRLAMGRHVDSPFCVTRQRTSSGSAREILVPAVEGLRKAAPVALLAHEGQASPTQFGMLQRAKDLALEIVVG